MSSLDLADGVEVVVGDVDDDALGVELVVAVCVAWDGRDSDGRADCGAEGGERLEQCASESPSRGATGPPEVQGAAGKVGNRVTWARSKTGAKRE